MDKLSLGIVLPTNNPSRFFDQFLPTVRNIQELTDNTTFLIHFQSPWRSEDVDSAVHILEAIGFKVKHTWSPKYEAPIPIAEIRTVAAELAPNMDVYMLADDDFKFSPGTPKYPETSGERYLQCLEYMNNAPTCGGIMTKGFLGGYHQKYKIAATWDDYYMTGRGLFLKNMKRCLYDGFLLFPDEINQLLGGLEEFAAVYSRMAKGYFFAKQMNNPTIHQYEKVSDVQDGKNMHGHDVIDANIGKWIRETYNDYSWQCLSKKVPKGVLAEYYKYSGIPLNKYPKLVTDYKVNIPI